MTVHHHMIDGPGRNRHCTRGMAQHDTRKRVRFFEEVAKRMEADLLAGGARLR